MAETAAALYERQSCRCFFRKPVEGQYNFEVQEASKLKGLLAFQ